MTPRQPTDRVGKVPIPGRTSCEIWASLRSLPDSTQRSLPVIPVPRPECLPGATDDDRDPLEPAHQHDGHAARGCAVRCERGGAHPRHALPQLRPGCADRALVRLSGLFRAARGGVRPVRGGPDADALRDRGSRPRDLAVRRAPPGRCRPRPRAAGRLHPARRRRSAGAGPRSRAPLDQGRHPQPLAELQGPGRRRRGRARRRVRRPGARLRLDRQPRRCHGRSGGRGRPAGLRVHPGRPRAGQGRPRPRLWRDGRADRRHVRRREPPVPRGRRRDGLGVREHQPPPVLRGGFQDARVRDRRVARLAGTRRDRRPGRLGRDVHAHRPRLRGARRARASSRRARSGSSAASPPAAPRSRPRSSAAPTSSNRSASPTRSSARWPSGTRPTGATPSSSRATAAARSRPSTIRRRPRRSARSPGSRASIRRRPAGSRSPPPQPPGNAGSSAPATRSWRC